LSTSGNVTNADALVQCEKEGNGLELKISVPPGTSGTVGLSASSGKALLTDNGRTFATMNKTMVGQATFTWRTS
jgi:hypothetical protein